MELHRSLQIMIAVSLVLDLQGSACQLGCKHWVYDMSRWRKTQKWETTGGRDIDQQHVRHGSQVFSIVTYLLTSLAVHTARDFSDFPLDRMFTEDDPYFLNVKQLAKGYEHFATKHHLVRV